MGAFLAVSAEMRSMAIVDGCCGAGIQFGSSCDVGHMELDMLSKILQHRICVQDTASFLNGLLSKTVWTICQISHALHVQTAF